MGLGLGSGLGAGFVLVGVGDGAGVGDAEGVVTGDGVTDGDGVGLGEGTFDTPTKERFGKFSTGSGLRIGSIIHVKTSAGIDPPVICLKPPKAVIGSADPSAPT